MCGSRSACRRLHIGGLADRWSVLAAVQLFAPQDLSWLQATGLVTGPHRYGKCGGEGAGAEQRVPHGGRGRPRRRCEDWAMFDHSEWPIAAPMGTPTTIAMVASVNACHLTTAAAWLGRRPMARSTACCRRRRTANVVRELQPSTPAGRPARLPRPALGEGLRWPARSQGRTVVGPGIEPSYRVTTGSGFWVILSSCRSMAGSASRCLSGSPRTGRRFQGGRRP